MIVNLQATPKDRRASLVIHARADRVMQHVMRRLACRIPVFRREDLVTVSCSQKAVTPSRGNKRSATRVAIAVGGRGVGARLPLPLLGSVGVTFLVSSAEAESRGGFPSQAAPRGKLVAGA